MSEFQSLDNLVAASPIRGPIQDQSPASLPTRAAPASRSASRAKLHGQRRTTRTEKKTTRLTGFPGFSSLVNQNDAQADATETFSTGDGKSQVSMAAMVMTRQETECGAADVGSTTSAGGQERPNPVNHAQVFAPQEFPDEIRRQLAPIGVNLRTSQLDRVSQLWPCRQIVKR